MRRPPLPFLPAVQLSMRMRLFLTLVVVLAVATYFFAADMVSRQRDFVQAQARDRAASLANTLAVSTTSWLIANDVSGLTEVLESLSAHPGVRYAMVLDPGGVVRGHSKPDLAGMEVVDAVSRGLFDGMASPRFLVTAPDLVDAAAPMFSSDRLVGWARVGLDLERESAMIADIRRDGYLFMVLAMGAGGLCALGIAAWFTRGLDDLAHAAMLVGAGLPKTRVKVSRKDELGLFGQAFNTMLDGLESNQASLFASEQRLRVLFESASDAIILADPGTGGLIDANPRASELFGLPLETLLGRDLPSLFEPGTAQAVRQALETVTPESPAMLEAGATGKDGGAVAVVMSMASATEFACGVRVVCILRDVSGQKKAREEILASLREKETLLKEVHHRVKNNMQVVVSLINLQSGGIEDPAALEALRTTQGRIHSMAAVHERLYATNDLARLDMRLYVPELAGHIRSSWAARSRDAEFEFELEDIRLPVDAAIPAGLALNEMLTNCFKHAFADADAKRKNTVRVRLARANGEVTLEVSDNGSGFGEGACSLESPLAKEATLGVQIIKALAGQLKGAAAFADGPEGARVVLRFPDPEGGGDARPDDAPPVGGARSAPGGET